MAEDSKATNRPSSVSEGPAEPLFAWEPPAASETRWTGAPTRRFPAAGHAVLVPADSPAMKLASEAVEIGFGKAPVLIREGGSIPIVQTFREILGVETLLLGLALPDCHAHAPNETFPVENFEAGIRLNQALLKELAVR